MNTYRMGIDIGSTTAKVAILDSDQQLVFNLYRRHNAEALLTLQNMIEAVRKALGNVQLKLLITGSAGMGITEKFHLPFIQEVIASAEVVRQHYPAVRTLIDIGGEDAKMIFFRPGSMPDIRMNGSCAGGTGAFIDQMASLLNIAVGELNALAAKSTTLYPMASRCGVFAKTDVQNLLSRDINREDIVASIFNAVVLQTLGTLARGYRPQAAMLLGGGPLTFLPELRRHFMRVLGLSPDDVINVEHAELLPAMGAAMAVQAAPKEFDLDELEAVLHGESAAPAHSQNRLKPLFDDKKQLDYWQARRMNRQTPSVSLDQVEGQSVFLGIDSGSTTTKVVVIDERARLVFKHYQNNNGNAIQAVRDGLEKVATLFAQSRKPPVIARSVVTGYGEDLIRSAFGCDEGMVETMAHFRAAREFDPEVSFVLDIGGQDMKAIFVKDGHIQNIEINEACSSGCGSFIESFARSMGTSVVDFAQKACISSAPCDLGTRCTVFMNSKVKQALREGAEVGDISAGLAYSVIKNALHKVLKITDTSVLGSHIIVQGGTFRNPAIHKAIEILLEREVLCPDISELMGAFGAALTARDVYQASPERPDTLFLSLERLESAASYQKSMLRCRGCENNCAVTRLKFENNNVFYTGNRCEKMFSNSGKTTYKGTSLPAIKLKLLFDRPSEPDGTPRLTLGIPRVLNFFENYPFWNALLLECGFKIQLSDPSSNVMYERGSATVMSENICFPAKLVHGHIFNLMDARVDRIFYPMVTFENPEFSDSDNSFNCPIVGGYPELIRSAIDPEARHQVPFDKPAITFKSIDLLKRGCFEYLSGLGVDAKTFKRAFKKAVEAQKAYKQAVRAEAQRILGESRAAGRTTILLMNRPYHSDMMINHKAPEVLADFGVDIITEDSVPLNTEETLDNKHIVSLWAYPNRYYHAARWAGEQADVEVVQLNSFGCGPDAVAVDEVKSILNEYGKSPTVIRIDEIESPGSMKLRMRSMIESLRRQVQPHAKPVFKARRTTPDFEKKDKHRTILAPNFAHFATLPITRPLMDMGYKVEHLPPADRQSVELGLKYTNNEICYPGIILVGDVIKALQTGKYNPDDITIGISQTGGQCRDSCYLSLFKKALVAAGFGSVPVVSLATNLQPLNEQPGFDLNYPLFAYKLLMGIVYTDTLSNMYHATAVREVQKGAALAAANRYLAYMESGQMPLFPGPVLSTLKKAVEDFNQIETRSVDYPKAAIVGEIYVKLNSFGNNHVVEWLMDQGIEVVMPPLAEYFSSTFVNLDADINKHLSKPDLTWLAYRGAEIYVQHFLDQAEKVLSGFKHYHPSHHIRHIAETASEILDLTNHYGEGWLIPGEIGSLVQDGVPNILCLQPFGCIANHVVAKGMEKRMKERYPELNILFLDADAGTSEVNFHNRLYFFVNHALEAKKARALNAAV